MTSPHPHQHRLNRPAMPCQRKEAHRGQTGSSLSARSQRIRHTAYARIWSSHEKQMPHRPLNQRLLANFHPQQRQKSHIFSKIVCFRLSSFHFLAKAIYYSRRSVFVFDLHEIIYSHNHIHHFIAVIEAVTEYS